jgi:predicted nuclease of predicted toxin-antitoxin system
MGMWLLLDVDFPYPAFTRLRAKGVKVLHAGDEGLAAYDDRQLLEYAREDDCLIVTRNYAGFARLAEAYLQDGRDFPGILFISADVDPRDMDAHVEVVERWLAATDQAPGGLPDRNRYVWID